jgi:hypothetical protein
MLAADWISVVHNRDKLGVAVDRVFNFWVPEYSQGRPQCPRDLKRRSAADRLLGSWVRIPPGAWVFVSCTVFVLSGRGVCDGPIPHPEESYRLWCVSECDQVKINNLDTCCE